MMGWLAASVWTANSVYQGWREPSGEVLREWGGKCSGPGKEEEDLSILINLLGVFFVYF